MRIHLIAAASCALALIAASPAVAVDAATGIKTVPASGTFSFSTGPGVLTTWSADDIALIGVSPGAVITNATGVTARVSLPIVARTRSANAAAGGFRINNVQTGDSVRCSTPTIDTVARVIDCVLPGGINSSLIQITSIGRRSIVKGASTTTFVYREVKLRLNGQKAADFLNTQLQSTTFSPYVTFGTGDLIVTVDS